MCKYAVKRAVGLIREEQSAAAQFHAVSRSLVLEEVCCPEVRLAAAQELYGNSLSLV